MTLRDGKFYNIEGNVAPPEHGNIRQIKLIQAHEKKLKDLQGNGLESGVTYTVTALVCITCICGKGAIFFEGKGHEDYDAGNNLDGTQAECPFCNRDYELIKKGEHFFIKLIKPIVD